VVESELNRNNRGPEINQPERKIPFRKTSEKLRHAMNSILKKLLTLAIAGALLAACNEAHVGDAIVDVPAVDPYGNELGSIQFPVSCNEQAIPMMERSLALLHHMTYTGAEAEFSRAIKADPQCALAYWGVAMSYIHPLWNDPPSEERLVKGLELLRQAESIENKTEREAGYIDSALAYYDGALGRREAESLVLFRDAWEVVYRQNPADIEAAAFYSLSLKAAADKTDQTQKDSAMSGAIAEQILSLVPDHPAGHHYIIHAYDSPSFAEQALAVARNYSEVAPEVPHALHMPTHIFTRLGYWDDSIAMNVRSAVAAEGSSGGEFVSSQMLHAQDYLVYAHLQKGNESLAQEVLTSAAQLQGPWDNNARGAAAYALAAMPARYALERRDWAAAAQNAARSPETFPWSDGFVAFEAISWFGRGLGAAMNNEVDTAQESIAELQRIKDLLDRKDDAYWSGQVAIQLKSIEAWIAYNTGETGRGLELMGEAASLENQTFKHPITPGEILPANELYGDMLLSAGNPEAALLAYRSSLERSPNRFNSLYGAAMAADAMGDTEAAASYFGQLVEMTKGSVVDWPRLKTARDYLALR
jgi:hypothetical protein